MVVFFFSSRRRHTRWNCDWSSDVCSSDLIPWACTATVADAPLHAQGIAITAGGGIPQNNISVASFTDDNPNSTVNDYVRSEERRVGKECRYRWSTYP